MLFILYSHHNLRVALSPNTALVVTLTRAPVCRPRGGDVDASLMGCDLMSYTIQYCPRIIGRCLVALAPKYFYGLETLCVCYNYKHKYGV